MTLLVDLFGYLSIVLHGAVIVAQSMTIGSVLFLVLLVRPLLPVLGQAGPGIAARTARIGAWAGLGLLAAELATTAMQVAVLMDTVELDFAQAMGADFARAAVLKLAAAAAMAGLLWARGGDAPRGALLAAAAVALAAATLTTHAAARLDLRLPLLAVSLLHQFGAAIWIGGIPAFIAALGRLRDPQALARVGRRFSRMSTAGVAAILLSGVVMLVAYVGEPSAMYGTAYGVMVGAKIVMFAGLLALGLGNFLAVERLVRDPAGAPIIRLRRFAEVEIGVGFTLFFAAASLTSVPPSVDLTTDRVTWAEIVARNAPTWPRLASPDHDTLALPALQEQLDREAQAQNRAAAPAFVPGSGALPVRNAADIAWSEYNHHWAGLFVLAIGILALAHRAGVGWARNWPLLFLGLAGFLAIRSDPEVWPLGQIGFFESLRDVEVLQHRFFVLLVACFAIFEWRVRTGRARAAWAPYVFPLVTAIGGAALLTHSHAIANVRDQLLIELSHTPLALAGILAGWTRWLELRLPGRGGRIAGWTWPICLILVGLILLDYREA